MSATRTYSPLPPMILAGDIFWTNPCILREPDPCPHTYGVRLSLRGSFATEPCRPTACIPAAPFRHTPYRFRPRRTATVWRNLQQHPRTHSSHTFSAKERDSETGFSYFGSRYYSSDLSIWLSVDPMSGKYPSLSPYVYCADNPVKLVDPNGEEVEIVASNVTNNKLSLDNQASPVLPQGKPTREQKLSNALSTLGNGKSITGEELAQAIGIDDVAKCVKSITRTGDNSFSVKRTALGMAVLKDSHLKINKVKLKINGKVETAYRIQIQYTKLAEKEGALPDFYINNDDILYYDDNGKLIKGYYEK